MAIWTVYLDSRVVHKPVTTERNITGGTLEIATDMAGSLEIDVPVTHPLYDAIVSLPLLGSPVWRVEKDGAEVFRGRTLSRKLSPIDATAHIVVEGDLAMLNDSLVEPYEFSGSPLEYLTKLVSGHNAQVEPWKRFTVGTVTAHDNNNYIVRSSESRVTTWGELSQKTFGSSTGGHIVLRRGTRTIDWLDSVAVACDQTERLGYNLIDLEDEQDGAELCTAIRALGADIDGTRVELSPTRIAAGVTLTNGVLSNDALVATNGTVVREVVWDDVTTEDVLWKRALAYVTALSLPRSVTVKAIDMADAGHDVDSFDLGMMVSLDALGTTGVMQVSGIKWDLLDPSNSAFSFGSVAVTSSARSASISSTAKDAKYVATSAGTKKSVADLTSDVSALSTTVNDIAAVSWRSLGTASTSGTTFALGESGTWLLLTGHSGSASLNGLWVVRTGGNVVYNLAGGGAVTVSVSGTSLTLTTTSGTVDVWACKLP